MEVGFTSRSPAILTVASLTKVSAVGEFSRIPEPTLQTQTRATAYSYGEASTFDKRKRHGPTYLPSASAPTDLPTS